MSNEVIKEVIEWHPIKYNCYLPKDKEWVLIQTYNDEVSITQYHNDSAGSGVENFNSSTVKAWAPCPKGISQSYPQTFPQFEKLWKSYPNKQGKTAVSLKSKKEVERRAADVAIALENYKKNKPSWQNWLNGSTFFNGRWVDWMESPTLLDTHTPRSKENFAVREYSEEFFEKFEKGY